MSRTVRFKIYKFNELKSEQAKQKAISWFRDGEDYQYLYDEAYESVKKFHNIFGTKEGSRNWLDIRTGHLDDNLLNLQGLRLRTYIINKFGDDIYEGKYFKSWATPNKVKHRNVSSKLNKRTQTGEEYYWNVYRSKVIFEKQQCCVFTGVCYDDSLLQPVYNFLDKYREQEHYHSTLDFDTLMQDCIGELKKDLENEVESRQQDEYVIEQILANEYEFTKDGERY